MKRLLTIFLLALTITANGQTEYKPNVDTRIPISVKGKIGYIKAGDIAALAANTGTVPKNTITFNVMDYGAKGDGVTDDSKAIQAAINAAVKAKGKLLIPPPDKFYNVTKTLVVKHPTDAECYMDIEAYGIPRWQIKYNGAPNTACFQFIGHRFSVASGVKVVLGNAEGLQAFDIDTSPLSHSTSFITYTNFHVVLGTGARQDGWRLGHVSGGGADISCLQWNNCSVFADVQIASQIGWHIEGGNTLQNVWNQCFAAKLGKAFSNASGPGASATGNGACYFYGFGTSQNLLDFEIANSQSYLISGGRFESGKRFLLVGNSNVSPSIVLNAVEINDYHPTDGVLFYLDMPCYLGLTGVNIKGGHIKDGFDQRMIMLYGGGEGTGVGRLIVDGGSVESTISRFTNDQRNKTKWYVSTRGVGRMNPDGVCVGMFDDVSVK
jgi:hypothetical protein